MKQDMINAWLWLFWNSQSFCLPDIKSTTGIDHWKVFSLESYLDINTDTPYGLFFTPNGNFWLINKVWEKLKRNNDSAEKYVAAFYVDIDLKDTDFANIDALFEETVKTILKNNLPVTYIVKSWWWLHLYMFVEESARYQVWTIWKFKDIQETFASFFIWWDKQSHSIAKLMRLPFSNHWKTGLPIAVELYQVFREWDKLEVEIVTDKEQIFLPTNVFSLEHIKNLQSNIVEQIDIRKELKISLTSQTDWDIDIVNKLPIESVLFKLEKYPRITDTQSIKFKVQWTSIWFETTNLETWVVSTELTDWYRINIKDNYVHNFSTYKHSIMERPRGQVYSFLYYYFNKDVSIIKRFLEEQFNIKLTTTIKDAIMPPLVSGKWTIVFTQGGVLYKKEIFDQKKKKLVELDTPLFQTPFKIKWVMESKYSLFWETSTESKYYLIERLDMKNNNEFIVEFLEDRKKFNRSYWKTGLIFLWTEEDLLDFYLAVNSAVWAWQIPKYTLSYLNGFTPDYFLMWDKFITPTFEILDEWQDTILKTQNIPTNFAHKDEISMREFCSLICGLFSERIAILSFLTYIALFLWHNFWKPIKDYKQQFMIPALIFSWKTKVWKSTLISILKEWSCLQADARRLSILSTSPQPIKQAATDSFVLHLEEFTGRVQPEKESIVRDIINKTNSSRWLPTGQNVEFNYRASIILDWERLPSSHSVVNRCVVCAMFEADKLWNEKALYKIRPSSFLKHLITSAYKVTQEEILEAYQKAEHILSLEWFSWRQLVLYAFPLAVNILFKVVSPEKVVNVIKENLSTLGEVSTEWDELSSLLSDIVITRRITPRIVQYAMDWWDIIIEVPITNEILWEKQIDLISILREYKWKINLQNHKLIIKYSKKDKELYWKISQFSQYFREWNV